MAYVDVEALTVVTFQASSSMNVSKEDQKTTSLPNKRQIFFTKNFDAGENVISSISDFSAKSEVVPVEINWQDETKSKVKGTFDALSRSRSYSLNKCEKTAKASQQNERYLLQKDVSQSTKTIAQSDNQNPEFQTSRL